MVEWAWRLFLFSLKSDHARNFRFKKESADRAVRSTVYRRSSVWVDRPFSCTTNCLVPLLTVLCKPKRASADVPSKPLENAHQRRHSPWGNNGILSVKKKYKSVGHGAFFAQAVPDLSKQHLQVHNLPQENHWYTPIRPSSHLAVHQAPQFQDEGCGHDVSPLQPTGKRRGRSCQTSRQECCHGFQCSFHCSFQVFGT